VIIEHSNLTAMAQLSQSSELLPLWWLLNVEVIYGKGTSTTSKFHHFFIDILMEYYTL